MDTLIYGILGIVILFASAFLLAYFDVFGHKRKNSKTEVSRPEHGMELKAGDFHRLASGIPNYHEGFRLKKKHLAHHYGIFAFMLWLKAKHIRKATPHPGK